MEKVVVITGPTAVGKTKLSIEIAKRFQTEIINGDAYQIYQKMNIGTAKPTKEEQSGIVHHMLDIVDPSCEYSVYRYQTDVRACIDTMVNQHFLPLIVGGSGLYIDSVIKDYRFCEEKRVDDHMYDVYSNEELYQMLENEDVDVASKIHPNNRKRLIRAIELQNSAVNKESRSHRGDYCYDTLLIFLNDERSVLYERINRRVDQMISDGLIEEVESIGENHFSTTSKAAIGYKECLSYLNGEISKDEMIDLIKKNSRHYAKRQFTWFKNKTNAVIVNIQYDSFHETIDEVSKLITKFISNK